MDLMIKESVATLFCYAIKLEGKDIKVEKPLFIRFMSQDFDCEAREAEELLEEIMEKEVDNIDTHISIISNALYNEPYSKMSILKQLNHLIFRGRIGDEDYDFFDKVKKSFFERKRA